MYTFLTKRPILMSKPGLSFCQPLKFTNSLMQISVSSGLSGVVEDDGGPKAIVLTISNAFNLSRSSAPPRVSRADTPNWTHSMRRRFRAPACSHRFNSNSESVTYSRLRFTASLSACSAVALRIRAGRSSSNSACVN